MKYRPDPADVAAFIANAPTDIAFPLAPDERAHAVAEELRDLARVYELDSSPLLTRRLLELAARLDRGGP